MKVKLIINNAIKLLLLPIVWVCFLYIGRFVFFYYGDYIATSDYYYYESLKDLDELREYIKEIDKK